jgi:hypothetical protein
MSAATSATPSLLQAEQEVRVAGQAVVRNQECCAGQPSMFERFGQFRPIVALAGLDFGVGLQELRVRALPAMNDENP